MKIYAMVSDTNLKLLQLFFIMIVAGATGIVMFLFFIKMGYSKPLKEVKFLSVAKVTKKEHPERINFNNIIRYGKNLIIQNYDRNELFNVFLVYNGIEYCISDKELYQKVAVGDIIGVIVHKQYKQNGKLKKIYLSVKD